MNELGWDDELRKDLMRWLMEFGDGWVPAAERLANAWYREVKLNAAGQTLNENYLSSRLPLVFEKLGTAAVAISAVRLNKRALAFLRGDEDETN